MKTISFVTSSAKALLIAATLAVSMLHPAMAQIAGPQITSIHSARTNIVVTVDVPRGLRKVTLESRTHLNIGAWEPRVVHRLDGSGGSVTFTLPATVDAQVLRVRANERDPLPESFYRGSNSFENHVRLQQDLNGNAPLAVDPGFSGLQYLSLAGSPPPGTAPLAGRAISESDIWKLRGDTLYYFNNYRGLQVINLSNANAPLIRGVFPLPAAGEQMYLLEDHYVVLLARKDCDWNATASELLVVNTDPSLSAPNRVAALPVPGRIIESRLVGTALYVASEAWQPQTNASGIQWEQGTHILSFDLANPERPLARSALWYPSGGSVIAATDRFLFVALRPGDNGGADVHCLDISAFDGVVQPRGSVRVMGEVADKFKMHLNGDVLSVISWGVNSNSLTVTKLETFSLAQPDAPARLGQLEFAQNEQLFATRFGGSRLYAVTYRRIDPLWVIDLSNPAAPSVSGELRIPGWSTYIQPWGDRLVTVGIDDVNGNRVAAQLFNVSDPAHPSLLSKVSLGENSSWSEATEDEKAVQILPEAGLILLPYQGWLTNGQALRVQLIDLTTNALTARGVIEHEFQPRRATMHGERIYSISPRELLTVDATNRDQPQVRSRLELSWPVDQVFVHGDYLLELTKSDAALRIVRRTAPDAVLASYILPDDWPVVGATVRDGKLYVAQRESRNSWPGLFMITLNVWNDTPNTNTPLRLSVLDLAALPALSLLGSADATNGPMSFSGEFEALWPRPDLLVWSGATSHPWNVYPGFRPIRLIAPQPILVNPVGSPGGVVLRATPSGGFTTGLIHFDSFRFGSPIYQGGGEQWLVAFDVENTAAPQFLSSVNVATNGGWNFSKAHEAAGLIYLSHQLNDRVVKETNYQVSTVMRLVTQTNLVAETNLTADYSYTLVTNTILRTNVSQIVQRVWPVGTRFSAGLYHTLALQPDGKVLSWGDNRFGQLGDGTFTNRAAARVISGLSGVSLSAGGFHNLVLQSDGTVAAWGHAAYGQLGNGVATPPPSSGPPPLPTIRVPTPLILTGFPALAKLAAGDYHSVAITVDGTVLSWGPNWYGQLGDGTMATRFIPVPVSGLDDVTNLAPGSRHNLAVLEDGSVWSWGRNDYGQLGHGNRADQLTPGAVTNLSDVVAVAAGLRHSLALKSNGSLWSWGADELQPGISLVPHAVPGLSNATAIAAGRTHSLALCADGSVWAWGQNDYGQLGTAVSSREPQRVTGVNGVATISAGAFHSVVAMSDGTMFAWGDNRFGQLGEGESLSTTNVLASTQVVTLTNLSYITNITSREILEQRYETITVTNAYEVVEWVERHYLDVVDYADPAHPTPRQPVNIPGQLAGISHAGALLYTLAAREDGGNTSARYLDASAYDDVSVWLVDSMRLPGDGSHPVLTAGTNIFLTRPGTTNEAAQIEAWTFAENTGRFTLRVSAALSATAHSLFSFPKMLAVQTSTELNLLDVKSLDRLGSGALPPCLGVEVRHAAGDSMRGLWVPLNDYGVQHIAIDP
jgi:alpha-tubulin suppressor-like RCC1 family protein